MSSAMSLNEMSSPFPASATPAAGPSHASRPTTTIGARPARAHARRPRGIELSMSSLRLKAGSGPARVDRRSAAEVPSSQPHLLPGRGGSRPGTGHVLEYHSLREAVKKNVGYDVTPDGMLDQT